MARLKWRPQLGTLGASMTKVPLKQTIYALGSLLMLLVTSGCSSNTNFASLPVKREGVDEEIVRKLQKEVLVHWQKPILPDGVTLPSGQELDAVGRLKNGDRLVAAYEGSKNAPSSLAEFKGTKPNSLFEFKGTNLLRTFVNPTGGRVRKITVLKDEPLTVILDGWLEEAENSGPVIWICDLVANNARVVGKGYDSAVSEDQRYVA